MRLKAEYTEGKFRARVRDFEVIYGGDKAWKMDFPVGYEPVDGIVPSEYLMVSIGGCAAMHVAMFCKRHSLPTEGLEVDVSWKGNARKGELINTVIINVKVPKVSENLEPELINEVKNCTVAASISLPPKFEVNLEK